MQRPRDAERQKQHYSGKKKRHTRKVQIIVNEHGVVREVSDSVPGAVHDRELFRQSGAAEAIPKATVTGGDAGYQGVKNNVPRSQRDHTFQEDQTEPADRRTGEFAQPGVLAHARIIIENILAQLEDLEGPG